MNILLDLSKQLQNITFEETPEQRARVAQGRVKNVVRYFDKLWAVRMRICGQQCNIGLTANLVTAARFSDMAHLYFCNIGGRSFRRNDFNFNRATAEADLNHPTAAPLLGEITQCLFPNGVPAKPVKAVRRTLRDRFDLLKSEHDELKARVAALEEIKR